MLDATSELYFASTILCNIFQSSNIYEQKYIEVYLKHFDKKALNPLQSVILCLKFSLKVDAFDGGNWLRSEAWGQKIM